MLLFRGDGLFAGQDEIRQFWVGFYALEGCVEGGFGDAGGAGLGPQGFGQPGLELGVERLGGGGEGTCET